MLIACLMANLQTVVVRTTLSGFPCQVDYVKGPDNFGPVTITLFDMTGKQVGSHEPYGGAYAFSNSDVLEGGRIGNPEYLIVRANDAPGFYTFVWVSRDGKLMHDDWSSRWGFGGVQGRGTQAIVESVDLNMARELEWGFDLSQAERKEFEKKKWMTISHFLVNGQHERRYSFH